MKEWQRTLVLLLLLLAGVSFLVWTHYIYDANFVETL